MHGNKKTTYNDALSFIIISVLLNRKKNKRIVNNEIRRNSKRIFYFIFLDRSLSLETALHDIFCFKLKKKYIEV